MVRDEIQFFLSFGPTREVFFLNSKATVSLMTAFSLLSNALD